MPKSSGTWICSGAIRCRPPSATATGAERRRRRRPARRPSLLSPRSSAASARCSELRAPSAGISAAARVRIGYDRTMRFESVVEASRAVAGTAGRLEKIGHLADLLTRVPPDEIVIVIALLSGEPRQGRMKIGGAALAGVRGESAAGAAGLELGEVDAVFERIAALSGSGSAGARAQLLRDLMRRATADEQDFLLRLLHGELRQGALEGVLTDAVARASGLPAAKIRRAAMLAGDLAPVARGALVDGDAGLARFALRPFQPVQPMLADSAGDVAAALTDLGEASFEFKLDGARIQAHKVDEEVRVYSRTLRDVTVAVPEVVSIVRAMPARSLVLDGEAIALRPDGTPLPFQETMRRFGRKLDVDTLKDTLPITPVFFDAIYVDGEPLVDEPLSRRVSLLNEQGAMANLVPRIVTADSDVAASFAQRSLATGHEGVMAKA